MTTAVVIPQAREHHAVDKPRAVDKHGAVDKQGAVDKHCALRAVVVPAFLADLRGPLSGLVELPQRLFWSGAERVFDLSDCDRLLEMYEAVFDAARTEADLAAYLNGETLARVWPRLALSPRVRRTWEAAHPELASTATASTAMASTESVSTAPVVTVA